MNKERLLNVAKALRESKNPDDFRMSRYVNSCGTPACAFGHYAARTDLQDEFCLIGTDVYLVADHDYCLTHASEAALEHFGFSNENEAHVFFGDEVSAEQCREAGHEGPFMVEQARTANEAADWIERYVATH